MRRAAAILVYLLLLSVGAASAVYDAQVERQDTVTARAHALCQAWPVAAFAAGMASLGLLVGLARLWRVPFLYAFAFAVLFFCAGHLFWPWKP